MALRWNTRSGRSKRPWPAHGDEYAAAMSLVLLSESGGGFCSTTAGADPTHEEAPLSATRSGLIIKIKRQKVASPDTPLPTPFYPCSMCDKVFQCDRAKKEKMVVVEDHHNSAIARAHECLLCHETLGTEQALGGHMRKHLDKSKLARKPADSNSTSANGENSSTSGTGAKPIFDLNMLPPPE